MTTTTTTTTKKKKKKKKMMKKKKKKITRSYSYTDQFALGSVTVSVDGT